jgi:hypothetical protein
MAYDQNLANAESRLERAREAVHRLNVDWATVRHECGDPKCGGDCRWVRQIEDALDLMLGGPSG